MCWFWNAILESARRRVRGQVRSFMPASTMRRISLKARLCVEGRQRLYRFASENSLSFRQTGKLIVATSDADRQKLASIKATAYANGVTDLRALTTADVAYLEPQISCCAALLSPSTGIIGSHEFMLALEAHLTSRSGAVVLATEVRRVSQLANGLFEIETVSGGLLSRLTARNIVVAAGLGMARLSAILPRAEGYMPPRTRLAKGHYFTLSGHPPSRHLIYPVPEEGGLGVHLTLDLQNRARFGPDVQWVETLDYAFDDPDGARRTSFETAIRRYWPELKTGSLDQGYTGIRPKISGVGEPPQDFEIHSPRHHGIANMVTLFGIESPGLTSSLAIGSYVTALLGDK